MNKLHFKQPLVAGFLAITLLLISSQIAYAHDGFSKQIIEGTFERLDLEINHGCAGNPVIAQTVLFPTLNPELSAYDSSNNPVTPPNDLAEVTDNGNLGRPVAPYSRPEYFSLIKIK